MTQDGRRRVVVTGLGVLAPNGKTLEEFWQANVQGQSGIDYITLFDATDFNVKIAGEVKNFNPSQYLMPAIYRKIDRFAQLGVSAAKMALDDAQIESKGLESYLVRRRIVREFGPYLGIG